MKFFAPSMKMILGFLSRAWGVPAGGPAPKPASSPKPRRKPRRKRTVPKWWLVPADENRGGVECLEAWTKSEARAKSKAALGLSRKDRLPGDYMVVGPFVGGQPMGWKEAMAA